MARTLKYTVDREPLDLEVGGEHFDAPALLAPAAIADLLAMQGEVSTTFASLQGAGQDADPKAMAKVLEFLADLFDLIFGESEPGVKSESAVRFRSRLMSKDNPFDLVREVVPAAMGMVQEYTGRPTEPSPPSSTSGGGVGTTSTAGPAPAASIPSSSPLGVSAT